MSRYRTPLVLLALVGVFLVPLTLTDLRHSATPPDPSDWTRDSVSAPVEALPASPKARRRILARDLRDRNDIHLAWASRCGITPYKTEKSLKADLPRLSAEGSLIYVTSRREFDVDRLTHSHPYLTPEAYALLRLIGERFRQKQIEQKMRPCRMIVTSMLRTVQSQKRLRHSNGNATLSTTSHLYATTFDLSARKFYHHNYLGGVREVGDERYARLLEETVWELRREGRLVAVREYRQACIHITVTR